MKAAFQQGVPLSFPVDSVEVKANWAPITEDQKPRYHWNYDSNGNLRHDPAGGGLRAQQPELQRGAGSGVVLRHGREPVDDERAAPGLRVGFIAASPAVG